VRGFRLRDAQGRLIHESTDNHQGHVSIQLAEPLVTHEIKVEVTATHGCPAAIARICTY